MKKILLVGPLIPPIHGQSLAFTRLAESIRDSQKVVINTNLEDKTRVGKILGAMRTLLVITIKAMLVRYEIVYFTCNRNLFESIKNIILINLASLRDIKIVNHLHGSDFYEFLHSTPVWYQKILLKSYKRVGVSVVPLDSMKDQFKDFVDMQIEAVPNFYDKDLDEELSEKEEKKLNIVYLSNILSSKGIFELIDAFGRLSKKYDNIYLNIAGDYIADEFMSREAVKDNFSKKIALNDRIKYVGKVFGADKVRLLQGSDIFVLPTYYKSEAFPISIIEAMACANAVVTTNYKYLPDVVCEQNGVLVEPRSLESLVDGLEILLMDIDKLRKIQRFNKKEATEKYRLDHYIDRLKQILNISHNG